MKFRKYLKICSLLILCPFSYAEFNSTNTFVEWDSANIQLFKENVSIFTRDEKSPGFLTIDTSKERINLEKENIVFSLLTDDIRAVNGIEIRLMKSRNSKDYYYYSVPFFDDYEFNLIKSSKKTKISLSKANFKLAGKPENEINFITIYFSSSKPNTRLTIWPITKTKKTSDGILSLTFDDGPKDNLLAAQILKKFSIPATAYIMPDSLGTRGFLTHKELKYLSTQNWDIESHHEIPFTYFEEKKLIKEITTVNDFLTNNKYKTSNYHLAYPLGKTNDKAYRIASKFFSTARIASGGVETIPPVDVHMLRSFNVLKTTTPEELRTVIEQTRQAKQWLILMFHHIKETPVEDIDYSTANFRKLAEIISKSKIKVMTIDNVFKKYLK